jgi:hypothetical protein
MRLVTLGVSLLAVLACTGSATPGGNAANLEACQRYVAHMNTLTPCMGVSYDADNLCTAARATDIDMTAYYDCLREHASCRGTEPVLDLDTCPPPTEEAG